MKPIIIETKDNKIVMDVSEFKKHIEDAYYQGYYDGSSHTTVQYNNDPQWWKYSTVNDPTITTTNSTDKIVGVLDNSIASRTITG